MTIQLLQGPSFDDFFTKSEVYKKILAQVTKSIEGKSFKPELTVPAVKLVVESVIKHNLYANHTGNIDLLLSLFDDDNSADTLKFFKPFYGSKELSDKQRHTYFHLKRFFLHISIEFMDAEDDGDDWCQSLKSEFVSLSAK